MFKSYFHFICGSLDQSKSFTLIILSRRTWYPHSNNIWSREG